MARKDEILSSFLKHEMFADKYKLSKEEIPITIRQALNSNVPIVKAIALVVDGMESQPPVTDSVLRNQILQYLNESAL